MVLFSQFLRHLHQLTSPLLRLVIPLSQRMTSAWPIAKQCDWNIQTRLKNQMLRTTGIPWDSYRMVPKKTSCGLEKVRPRLCTRKSTRLCMRIFDSSLHAGPCTRISSSLQWNLRYFTLTFSIVLYHHPLRYFTLLHCALLHYSGSGLQTSELLLYFSAAPLHSRLLRYFSTSGGADFIHCTLLFSPLYSTLRSATLLYCATHYSTSFYITLLLYSTLTLFYSTPVKFTLLYFALYKHSTLLGLWASDF